MPEDHGSLQKFLTRPSFPLANRYDPQWIIENQMGLKSILLTEWLSQEMKLSPGMRVLDLGCGKGLASIFLAREFNLQVWACDLWISATENFQRVQEAGLADRIFPLHVDARELPFAEGFFDAILSIDAYIYFGTDDLYLDTIHKFVKTGGQIGIAVPGFMQELDGELPEHLLPFWAQECWTWHTVNWWKNHWARTGLVEVQSVEPLPEGWQIWLDWKKARFASGDQRESVRSDIQVLEADQGRYMGFIRMVASRK